MLTLFIYILNMSTLIFLNLSSPGKFIPFIQVTGQSKMAMYLFYTKYLNDFKLYLMTNKKCITFCSFLKCFYSIYKAAAN